VVYRLPGSWLRSHSGLPSNFPEGVYGDWWSTTFREGGFVQFVVGYTLPGRVFVTSRSIVARPIMLTSVPFASPADWREP